MFLTWVIVMLLSTMLLPLCTVPADAEKLVAEQLQALNLTNNQLMGSLPENWSHLANVSPIIVAIGQFLLDVYCVVWQCGLCSSLDGVCRNPN